MTKELAKALTTALIQFIDRERPEGTMCCSSYECEKIEKAFEGGCYDIVEEFIKKKLEAPLTPFQQCLNGILRKVYFAEAPNPTAFIIKCIQNSTKELLELAKKQLLSYPDESNPAIEAMAELERTFECNPDKLPRWLKNEIERIKRDAYTRGYNKGYKDAEDEYNKSVAYHCYDGMSATLKAEG